MACYLTDWDLKDSEEILTDEQYRALIDLCFQNSDYISFSLWDEAEFLPELKKYPYLYIPDFPTAVYLRNTVLLRCSQELKQYVANANFLFEREDDGRPLGSYPEDISFYRKDGTLFFWSCTHEGVAFLLTTEDEFVPNEILQPYWRDCAQISKKHVLLPVWREINAYNLFQNVDAEEID